MPSDKTRGSGLKVKHRNFHLNLREDCFYYDRGKTLDQVVQGGCGVSFPPDTQTQSILLGNPLWLSLLEQEG